MSANVPNSDLSSFLRGGSCRPGYTRISVVNTFLRELPQMAAWKTHCTRQAESIRSMPSR